eukprot:CAMPEP_0113934916 /NCGR_PEP_ID=MMETSP1339-20121228/2165_1 /TAXON_ID=94617 /ORGANISM="Fibrocapsa japonica" /LENGTH=344 /DNA_ID=CAMNT_0000936889 /DNA_START=93 /DNA_END=1127 /DNA_ORIENTATION=+ /assembly_acc=CAM_ASM_000762
MKPILLKGHERSITAVLYNNDGDLLFTAAKDNVPTLWYASNGERVGTYNGHAGAVWGLDVSWDSTRLISGSADATVRMWEVETGKELVCFNHKGPVRAVAWSDGAKMFCSVSDAFMESPPFISVYHAPDDVSPEQMDQIPFLEIELPVKATKIGWLPLNKAILAGFEDGSLRTFDPKTGEELACYPVHTGVIKAFSFNKEKTLLLSSSADNTAKLVDVATFDVLKTYKTERPVNAAVISPIKDHVLLGGGQEAMSVTTTDSRVGKFETRFYHLVYEREFGRVKGHFGPINALGINPDGKSYASGAEDGYIRLHHFDQSYLDMEDDVPDATDDSDSLKPENKAQM